MFSMWYSTSGQRHLICRILGLNPRSDSRKQVYHDWLEDTDVNSHEFNIKVLTGTTYGTRDVTISFGIVVMLLSLILGQGSDQKCFPHCSVPATVGVRDCAEAPGLLPRVFLVCPLPSLDPTDHCLTHKHMLSSCGDGGSSSG